MAHVLWKCVFEVSVDSEGSCQSHFRAVQSGSWVQWKKKDKYWCINRTYHSYSETWIPHHTSPTIWTRYSNFRVIERIKFSEYLIWCSLFIYLLICPKFRWLSGKQCRPRSDAAFYGCGLICVYTVCSGLSIPILRVYTVSKDSKGHDRTGMLWFCSSKTRTHIFDWRRTSMVRCGKRKNKSYAKHHNCPAKSN